MNMKKEIKFDLPQKSLKIENENAQQLSFFFNEDYGVYLNAIKLYALYFKSVPNCIFMSSINCQKALEYLIDNYANEIKDWYFSKRYIDNEKLAYDDLFFLIFEDTIIHFDTSADRIKIIFKQTDKDLINTIVEKFELYKKRRYSLRIPRLHLLIDTHGSLETIKLNIKLPKLNFEDNYNDDLINIHENIIKRLKQKNDKGLVLLHGKPGTGKTTYVRYLMKTIKKPVIFLPTNLAEHITNPEFINILIRFENSVLVIEDAEQILLDRNNNGHSPVSTILNITDDLLSDCLNIQIICTFNTDISKIDKALLRKGRLIAQYEFKELEIEKAQRLSDKIGFDTIISKPMTLTAIYNQGERDYQLQEYVPIGYRKAY